MDKVRGTGFRRPTTKQRRNLGFDILACLNKMFSRRQNEKKDPVVDEVKQFVKVSGSGRRRRLEASPV